MSSEELFERRLERQTLTEPLLDDENVDISSYILTSSVILIEGSEFKSRVTNIFNQAFYSIIGMLCQTL